MNHAHMCKVFTFQNEGWFGRWTVRTTQKSVYVSKNDGWLGRWTVRTTQKSLYVSKSQGWYGRWTMHNRASSERSKAKVDLVDEPCARLQNQYTCEESMVD